MRRKQVLIIGMIILLFVAGCRKNNRNVSFAPLNKGTEAEKEPMNQEERKNMLAAFMETEYNQSDGEDRIALSADWVLNHFNKGPSDGTGVGICLITLMEADTEKCVEETGTYVPIKIRIDKVIVSNGLFKNKSGDVIETSDFSAWMKKEGGYVVWAPEGQIPVAIEGAQYIAQVGEVTEEVMKQLPLPVGYRTHSFTIPIVDESIITQEEIYNKMNLPDDVQKCSEELIEMFIQ